MLRAALEFLTTPSNLFMLLLVAGIALAVLRLRRLGLSAIGLGTLGLVIFGYTSAGEVLMAPLVSRFPPMALETAPDPFGLILVGGGVNETHAQRTGTPMELTEDGDAVPIAVLMARRFLDARIVVSAGGGPPPPLRQADGIKRILTEFGVDAARIAIDNTSRNTHERVRNALALIGEDRDRAWWVVTSAHQMPRVIGTFRRQGMDPIPYPVDFRWIPPINPFYTYRLTDGLRMTDIAVKEWLGLTVYWHRDRTSSFFPGP